MSKPATTAKTKESIKPTPNDVLIFHQHLMHKEDVLRERFRREVRQGMRKPPSEVDALIKRIRRAVEIYMNRNGGSVPSIMRRLFLKYDHQVTGNLGPNEMAYVLNYLKCPASHDELQGLVKHYAEEGKNGMGYQSLVKDVLKGMRHYLQFPTTRSNPELYSPSSDPTRYRPKEITPLITTFVRKLKEVLLRKVTRGGSTEETELDKLFHRYGEKGVWGFQAFRSAIHSLGIKMLPNEAQQVYKHFAEENYGGIRHKPFIKDVLSDISHWSKMSTEDQLRKLQLGPTVDWTPSTDSYRSDMYKFTSRPIRRPANIVVEKFKQKLKHICDRKILQHGDLMYWILLRPFALWDAATSDTRGRLGLKHFKGALKKLSCPCTDEECLEVIRYYDMDNSGMITYKELIKDILKLDRNWMSYSEGMVENVTDFSARVTVPPIIEKLQSRIKQSAQEWASRFPNPQSAVSSRDAFHGICLRFDPNNEAHVSIADFSKVLRELRLSIGEKQQKRLVHWYMVGGGSKVDYGRILKDVFPSSGISNNSQSASTSRPAATIPSMSIWQAEKLVAQRGLVAFKSKRLPPLAKQKRERHKSRRV